jgi:hypothetical protein
VHTAIASPIQPSGEGMSRCAAASAVSATSQYTITKGSSFATLARTNVGVARGPRAGRGQNDKAVAAATTRTPTR